MAVVVNTPVESPIDRDLDTPCVDDDGGWRSSLAGARIDLTSNQEYMAAVLGAPQRFHYASRDKLCVVSHAAASYFDDGDPYAEDHGVATVSLGIQAIHQAFAAHVPLSLTPDLLWYLVVHEVAEHVRQNPGRYTGTFTRAAEWQQTVVTRDDRLRQDDPSCWPQSIGLVRDPLRAGIGEYSMELFLPQFSTTTEEAETALLIALMDVASPYYRYEWYTACGIPQIRLDGTAADWQSLHFRADQLAREFAGLSGYFTELLPVLQAIAETASGTTPDENFWRSIYKHMNSSGGMFVTGWITAFLAYIKLPDGSQLKHEFDWRSQMSNPWGGYKTNWFPSHVSKVQFVWDEDGTWHDMTLAAGITGVDLDDDTFLAPRLGFAVTEATRS
jgi:Domain of unknown function (DUF4419)